MFSTETRLQKTNTTTAAENQEIGAFCVSLRPNQLFYLLIWGGFSIFASQGWTAQTKSSSNFNADDIDRVLKLVKHSSFNLEQLRSYLDFLVMAQEDIQFSVKQSDLCAKTSRLFEGFFKRWLDFSKKNPNYPDICLSSICARPTDEAMLRCFTLVENSALSKGKKKHFQGQLNKVWVRFNRDAFVYQILNPIINSSPIVEATLIPSCDSESLGSTIIAKNVLVYSDERQPKETNLDKLSEGPASNAAHEDSRVVQVPLANACYLFQNNGSFNPQSLIISGANSDCFAQLILNPDDLEKLKSLLMQFNTFLPKCFFGDVPTGMKEVITLIDDNNASTVRILNKLKEVAKNRTGQNIWHTRQGKTIEAYKAIDEFFSGNLQEKKMEDLLDALSNIIAPKEPMVPPVLTEVSL